MRSAAMVYLAESGKAGKDSISKAVKSASEANSVNASVLRKELEASGYTITDKKLKFLTRVEVKDKKGNVVAQGQSEDKHDALLQAVKGYYNEQ